MSLLERQKKHVLFTWSAQDSARPVHIERGEGAVFRDQTGAEWLDFESQVFNANAGHGQQSIVDAIAKQAQTLAVAHPAAVYETKAALGEALAGITPGDLDHFFLCLSGAEAVENAYKMARMVTGRNKVIARRRSYHGASMGALSLTGDWRRWPLEPGVPGVIRAEDPYCYRCPFGLEPTSCGTRCATHIEHIIEMEGPETIAAIVLESITGANGGFIPPPDYWPRIRDICDRHGILLIADEVFTGFGRTGKWFAVEHWGVVPDMITMAKGLTGGYAPMGAVAMRPFIAEHFAEKTLWCGLTSYAHPIACAAALAAIEAYHDQGLMENAARQGIVLESMLEDLRSKYSNIGDIRTIGLFGTIEFVADRESKLPYVSYAQSPAPRSFMAKLRDGLRARRVHAPMKGNWVQVCPPTCITEEQLTDGVGRIDAAIAEALKETA